MNSTVQQRYTLTPLFLAAALFVLLCPLFWISSQSPGGGQAGAGSENADLYQRVFPSLQYGVEALRSGRFPLWNDRAWCGTPYFSDARHGLLQPLVLPFIFLDFPRALALHAFIALSATGFFFVLFMRSMNVRYIPATVGGVVFVCCGAVTAAMSNPVTLQTLMWFPLACWATRENMREPRWAFVIAGGLALTLLLLGGALLPALVMTAFVMLYGLLAACWGTGPMASPVSETGLRLPRLWGMLGMALLAILLSGMQWMPFLEWVSNLEDPRRFLREFLVAGEIPSGLRGLFSQLLDARPQTLPSLGRLGIMTLLFVPAAFLHQIPRWERVFFGLAIPGLVIISLMQEPGGMALACFFPATFALSVLASLGLDRLFAARRDPTTPRLWAPVALVALLFVLLFIFAPDSARGRMLPVAIATALFVVFRSRWAAAAGGILILVFLYVDLSSSNVNRQDHPFFQAAPELALETGLNNTLRETALDGRIFLDAAPEDREFHPNIGMSAGLHIANGTALPLSREQARWWAVWNQLFPVDGKGDQGEVPTPEPENTGRTQTPGAAMLKVMAVKALATKNAGSESGEAPFGLKLEPRAKQGRIAVFSNPDGLSRVYWAPYWRLAVDDDAAIDAVCAPEFDPQMECIIAPGENALNHLVRTVPDARDERKTYPPPRIIVGGDRPERISAKLETPAPGILVLSETFEPGWRVTVNGRPSPLIQVNGLFAGVALGQGAHEVWFEYTPPLFLLGTAVSAVTALALVAGIISAKILDWRQAPH